MIGCCMFPRAFVFLSSGSRPLVDGRGKGFASLPGEVACSLRAERDHRRIRCGRQER